jgi:hypothetical protein
MNKQNKTKQKNTNVWDQAHHLVRLEQSEIRDTDREPRLFAKVWKDVFITYALGDSGNTCQEEQEMVPF